METTLYQKIFITGNLICVTGLHIGDSKDSVEIGGLDGPVVRRKDGGQPYIPGSSLKGKIRSLLQQLDGELGFTASDNSRITKLFGGTEKKEGQRIVTNSNSSRLLVRDAYLTKKSEEKLSKLSTTDMPYTEQKYENSISRITGTTDKRAGGVRSQERVPAGAEFAVNFVINIYGKTEQEANDNQESFLNTFWQGIALLQGDYLGGSGSRGYGQVLFEDLKVDEIITREKYKKMVMPEEWSKKIEGYKNKDNE